MNERNKFYIGFEKVAAPLWFYSLNRQMNPVKSAKSFSKRGIRDMLKKRGIR